MYKRTFCVQTKSMRGRILNMKKTTILRLSFIINSLLFVVLTTISIIFLGKNDNYFFLFCFFVGLHLIVKSMMFKLDSSCYFGSLLFFLAVFYFYSQYLNILYIYPVFVVLCFGNSSLLAFYYFSQPLHGILAFSLFFVAIGLLIYQIKFISLIVFLAIVAVVVLLLVIRFLTIK